MREIVKTYFVCEICKKEYIKPDDALTCEAYPLESSKFQVGDKVRIKEQIICTRGCGPFRAQGVVTEISPHPSVGNLTTKDGRRSGKWGHVFQYEVKCKCPKCRRQKTLYFWTSELVKTA